MGATNLQRVIHSLTDEACDEGLRWLRKQESFQQAWNKCKRGDWMKWLVGRSGSSELYNKLFYSNDCPATALSHSIELIENDLFYAKMRPKNQGALRSRLARRRANLADAIRKKTTRAELKQLLASVKLY